MYEGLEKKKSFLCYFYTLSLRYHIAQTLKAHDAAHDHDVPRTPLLHVGHHFFDHAHHTKEVGLKHQFHLLDADALNWSQQAHACIVDWRQTNQLSPAALSPPLRPITDVTTRCQPVTTTRGPWPKRVMVKALWLRGHQPSPGRPSVQQGFLSYQVGSCLNLGFFFFLWD